MARAGGFERLLAGMAEAYAAGPAGSSGLGDKARHVALLLGAQDGMALA
jgi:hypothetical protein